MEEKGDATKTPDSTHRAITIDAKVSYLSPLMRGFVCLLSREDCQRLLTILRFAPNALGCVTLQQSQ